MGKNAEEKRETTTTKEMKREKPPTPPCPGTYKKKGKTVAGSIVLRGELEKTLTEERKASRKKKNADEAFARGAR